MLQRGRGLAHTLPSTERGTLARRLVIGSIDAPCAREGVLLVVNTADRDRVHMRAKKCRRLGPRTLLRHVRRNALPFTVFELGNEPNAYPYLQNGLVVTPEQFANDFFALSRARDELLPKALLAIPGTAW